jgi:hypothetical protein
VRDVLSPVLSSAFADVETELAGDEFLSGSPGDRRRDG